MRLSVFRNHRLRNLLVTELWLIVYVLGFFSFAATLQGQDRSSTSGRYIPSSSGTRPSVVVVPFQNLSSDSSADWIGGGIAATIVADFGRRNQMSAIRFNPLDAGADQSRWWASSFDNSDAVDAARRLGAKWVITGGYQLLDEKIRITSLLVDLEAETVR